MLTRTERADAVMAVSDSLKWLGQSTVKCQVHDKVIYIDPYQIQHQEKADIILITHPHADHLSPADITKLLKPDTLFVVPQSCRENLAQFSANPIITVMPGETCQTGELMIETVPAYNLYKNQFHHKNSQWVGYILTLNNIRVYHTGDTERIPEMKQVHCDIILVPLGQTYTMNSVQEAANAVLDTGASIAIPIHYGLYEGTREDAEKLVKILDNQVTVSIKHL